MPPKPSDSVYAQFAALVDERMDLASAIQPDEGNCPNPECEFGLTLASCESCQGSGWDAVVEARLRAGEDAAQFKETGSCEACRGEGVAILDCHVCAGSGLLSLAAAGAWQVMKARQLEEEQETKDNWKLAIQSLSTERRSELEAAFEEVYESLLLEDEAEMSETELDEERHRPPEERKNEYRDFWIENELNAELDRRLNEQANKNKSEEQLLLQRTKEIAVEQRSQAARSQSVPQTFEGASQRQNATERTSSIVLWFLVIPPLWVALLWATLTLPVTFLWLLLLIGLSLGIVMTLPGILAGKPRKE